MKPGTPKIARIVHALELLHAAHLRQEAAKMCAGSMDRLRFLREAKNRVIEAERIRLFASLTNWRSVT